MRCRTRDIQTRTTRATTSPSSQFSSGQLTSYIVNLRMKNDINGGRYATAKRKEQSDDADLIFKSKEFLFVFVPARDSSALLPSVQ